MPNPIDFSPLPELIDGILPAQEVSILAGASGAGKTTLLMQCIRALQHNEFVFGHKAQADLTIGYIAADRSFRAYARLAHDVGVDLEKIKVRAIIDDPSIDTQKFEQNPMALLSNLIGQLLPCDLIVIDPLIVFLGIDANRYHLVAARLIKLNQWCQRNNTTILGTHHATKARTDYSFKRPQDRISGSSALLGFTSTQLFIASPEETGNQYTEWYIVSHHAPAETIQLSRNNGLFQFVDSSFDDDPLVGLFDEKKNKVAHDIANALWNIIPEDKFIPYKELRLQTSSIGSPRSLDDVLKVLFDDGILIKDGVGGYGRATAIAH